MELLRPLLLGASAPDPAAVAEALHQNTSWRGRGGTITHAISAADLQLVAAAGNARWVEYITPSPYVEDLFAEPIRLDAEGRLAIPDGPGLGFAWNPDGIARHTRGLALTPSVL